MCQSAPWWDFLQGVDKTSLCAYDTSILQYNMCPKCLEFSPSSFEDTEGLTSEDIIKRPKSQWFGLEIGLWHTKQHLQSVCSTRYPPGGFLCENCLQEKSSFLPSWPCCHWSWHNSARESQFFAIQSSKHIYFLQYIVWWQKGNEAFLIEILVFILLWSIFYPCLTTNFVTLIQMHWLPLSILKSCPIHYLTLKDVNWKKKHQKPAKTGLPWYFTLSVLCSV